MRLYVYSFLRRHRDCPCLPIEHDRLSLQTSVVELKRWIAAAFDVPYHEQRLTFAARDLHDGQRLHDHRGLAADKTLHLLKAVAPPEPDPAPPVPADVELTAKERQRLAQEAEDFRIAQELARSMRYSDSDSD